MLRGRADGRLARDVPAYRRIMPLITRTRTESTVLFSLDVKLARTLRFLEEWNAANPDLRATPFHVVVWAIVETLARRPELNRFVAGGRLWDRDGIWISFAAKQRLDDEAAPLVTVKRRLEAGRPFADLVRGIRGDVTEGRSDRVTTTDREVRLVTALPVTLQRLFYAVFRWADAWGLLPLAAIAGDPLYTSVFVGNLGSLRMDACSHHLYEHGTASVFCVIGRVREAQALTLEFTLDERVADGLYAHRSLELLRTLIEDPGAPLPGH